MVGCGSWGATVARRICRGDVPLDVSAVVDVRHGVAEALAHELGRPWYALLEDAVGDTGSEWAVVALPPGDTRQAVCEELRALGVDQIRVEKPLLEDPQWVDAVGHQTLFAPEARLFRALVLADGVRDWQSIRIAAGPPRTDLGAALDLAVHDIALKRWVLGPTSVGRHVVDYDCGVSVRRTTVQCRSGNSFELDEIARTVTYPGGVVSFADAPDPLGCELRAWAEGRGVDLDIAAYAADAARRMEGVLP